MGSCTISSSVLLSESGAGLRSLATEMGPSGEAGTGSWTLRRGGDLEYSGGKAAGVYSETERLSVFRLVVSSSALSIEGR